LQEQRCLTSNFGGSELIAWVTSLSALIEVDPKLDDLLVNSTPS
jgi:hypothetical protein